MTPAVCDVWERVAAGRSGKGATWRHLPSGWVLHHCGHPTANWPYYLTHPQVDAPVVSFNGLGFKSVAAAKLAIEHLHAGRSVASTDRCLPGVRRLLGVTAAGDLDMGLEADPPLTPTRIVRQPKATGDDGTPG
jgi:hypothetical protein